MTRKFLWVVDVNTDAVATRVFNDARTMGAHAVVVNTKNARLNKALIDQYHHAGIKVFGWRWPAIRRPTSHSPPPHYFAMDEVNFVVGLIPLGLDGYIVDPEADEDRNAINFWNNAALKPLTLQFAQAIRTAGGPQFHFGITSGCSYPTSRPHIPWAEFFQSCDAGYPQSYWRADLSPVQDINGGTPAKAIQRGLQSWATVVPAGKPIIPMAGEIKLATEAELVSFASTMAAKGITDLHFYTDEDGVPPTHYTKIATF